MYSLVTHAQPKCVDLFSTNKTLQAIVLKQDEASITQDIRLKIVTDDAKISESEMQNTVALYSQIANKLNGYVNLPNQLTIQLFAENDTGPLANYLRKAPAYDLINKVVRIPYRYYQDVNSKDVTKHPKMTRAVQIHEIGHFIFDHQLNQYAPSVKKIRNLFDQISLLRKKNSDVSSQAYKVITENFNSDQLDKYSHLWKIAANAASDYLQITSALIKTKDFKKTSDQNKINELSLKQIAIHQDFIQKRNDIYNYIKSVLGSSVYNEYIRLLETSSLYTKDINELQEATFRSKSIETAYEEFMADAITVIVENDPKAISTAINFDTESKRMHIRDFSKNNSLSTLPTEVMNYFGYSIKATDSYGQEISNTRIYPNYSLRWYSLHNILDATRSYVWNKYISNPTYNRNPGQLVQILSVAAAKEIEFQLQNQKLLSPKEMNEHFIEQIDLQFSLAFKD